MRRRDSGSFKVVVGVAAFTLLYMAAPSVAEVADTLLLNRKNESVARTTVAGPVERGVLRLRNTGADGVALVLRVEDGNPPLRVTSETKVKRLNADLLDGRSAGAFLLKEVYDTDRDGLVDQAARAGSIDGVPLVDLLPGGELPGEATLRGVFALGGAEDAFLTHGVDFGYTMTSAPTVHYIEAGAGVNACPGSAANPLADPGHLCIYETSRLAVKAGGVDVVSGSGASGASSKFGFLLAVQPFNVTGPNPFVYGSWAATAPIAGAAAPPVAEPAGIYGR
jgi:hypothetical protein